MIVLFLNSLAYSAKIFYGALLLVPKGNIEATDAIGMSPICKFRRMVWPSMLRLSWASYANEATFMFHATALVDFSRFPAWGQKGDALYYVGYFVDKAFNPFVPYPGFALYFVSFTLILSLALGRVNKRLNRHIAVRR